MCVFGQCRMLLLHHLCTFSFMLFGLAVAQAGLHFPGLGYEAVPWYDQFNEFASKNPGGLAQVRDMP